MKISHKIFIVLGSIAFLYLLYLIWALYAFGGGLGGPNRTMRGEIHLIPNNYIGNIHILFDQNDGLRKECQRNKRLYKIPKSGILKTQLKPNLGWIRSGSVLEFYYINDSGDIINKLKWNFNSDTAFMKKNLNDIGVIGFGYGGGASWENGPQNVDMLYYSIDTLNTEIIRRKGYGQPKPISKEELDNWNK